MLLCQIRYNCTYFFTLLKFIKWTINILLFLIIIFIISFIDFNREIRISLQIIKNLLKSWGQRIALNLNSKLFIVLIWWLLIRTTNLLIFKLERSWWYHRYHDKNVTLKNNLVLYLVNHFWVLYFWVRIFKLVLIGVIFDHNFNKCLILFGNMVLLQMSWEIFNSKFSPILKFKVLD